MASGLRIIPIRLKLAKQFVFRHHRHHKESPAGWLFGCGLQDDDGALVGVAIAGRPEARALDSGAHIPTIEVTRSCTTGTRNANSMLYGAIWRAAVALGYRRGVTYTQAGESGASLRAAGWKPVATLPPRGDWAESSVAYKHLRVPAQCSLLEPQPSSGGVERVRWEKVV